MEPSVHELQKRLQAAEARTRSALEQTPADHPLAMAVQEFLEAHSNLRDLVVDMTHDAGVDISHSESEITTAALELEREEHTAKADFKDVIKALFLWKEHPVDRARNN